MFTVKRTSKTNWYKQRWQWYKAGLLTLFYSAAPF